MKLNQRTFHNLQSHLAYLLTKICILIRHIIFESLVEIEYLRHEGSSKIYENSQKRYKIKDRFITYSHIKYELIRHVFCESLVKICATKRKY